MLLVLYPICPAQQADATQWRGETDFVKKIIMNLYTGIQTLFPTLYGETHRNSKFAYLLLLIYIVITVYAI
jgi:hypothetical protein